MTTWIPPSPVMMVEFSLILASAALLAAAIAWVAIIELTAKVKRLANQIDQEQIVNTQLQNELIRQSTVLGVVCQSLMRSNILPSDIDEASKR